MDHLRLLAALLLAGCTSAHGPAATSVDPAPTSASSRSSSSSWLGAADAGLPALEDQGSLEDQGPLDLGPFDLGPDAGPLPMTGDEACGEVHLVCADADCPWFGSRECDRELVAWCAGQVLEWAEAECPDYDGAQCTEDQGCPVDGQGVWPGLWDAPCEAACW